jgi:hypothetical protein
MVSLENPRDLDAFLATLQELVEDYYAGEGDVEIAKTAVRLAALLTIRERSKPVGYCEN